ncbi:MAG: hypothetical protein WAU02_04405 [Candidatus Saccharimonadales bacterium]
MSEGFTSRHGKYTAVVAEELQSSRPTSPAPARSSQSKKPRPRRKFAVPQIKLSKRTWAIVASIVVIGGIAALLSADSVKRDYERQAAAMNRSIAEAGKQSPSDGASAVAVADTLLAALSAPTRCSVTGIDVISWYGPAKTARQDCQATAERYGRLRSAVSTLKSVALYTTSVDTALAPALASPRDGGYAIVSDYTAAWKKANEDIGALRPEASLQDAHASLATKVSAIRDAWQKLETASGKHDKAAFQSAETELGKAYEDLRGVADQLHGVLQRQQTAITEAISVPR